MISSGVIAIIPARGGSKRLPRKNIKLLSGKPLIAWTIIAAKESHVFDRIIVSTDDEEIAKISNQYGAETPFLRPQDLSSDTATTDDVVTHAVKWLRDNDGYISENITVLQPTSPLRDGSSIIGAFDTFKKFGADAVVSVCEVEHPLELAGKLPEDLSLSHFISPKNIKRSQDIPTSYRLNGAIYIYSKGLIGKSKEVYSTTSKSYAYKMPREKSVDIDDELDFLWAEFLVNKLKVE
tara:strand:+ start:2030 stop:2740 length:711 start_codon:yes stop_codon:yes gene_type:complete